jgi:hypothetical protein
MLIFCSGPYSAESLWLVALNLERARSAAAEVLLAGHTPICPHLITAYLDIDPKFQGWSHEDWLTRFCYPLIDACDAVYLYPTWETSKGARKERDYAMQQGKVILLSMSDLGKG